MNAKELHRFWRHEQRLVLRKLLSELRLRYNKEIAEQAASILDSLAYQK